MARTPKHKAETPEDATKAGSGDAQPTTATGEGQVSSPVSNPAPGHAQGQTPDGITGAHAAEQRAEMPMPDTNAPVPESSAGPDGEQAPAGDDTGAEADVAATATAPVADKQHDPEPDPVPEPERRGPFVLVTGPAAGRRRANRAFGPEPVKIHLADLTDAEQAAIVNDPMLRISGGGED